MTVQKSHQQLKLISMLYVFIYYLQIVHSLAIDMKMITTEVNTV